MQACLSHPCLLMQLVPILVKILCVGSFESVSEILLLITLGKQ